MLVYNKTTRSVTKEAVRVPGPDEVAWIRLRSPQPEELEHVLHDMFRCHPLLVEDCIKMNQRPKMDRYQDRIFISFYALNEDLSVSEIATVIGENFVITIYRHEIRFFDELYAEFEQVEGKMEHAGQVLYHILDRTVDEYVDPINRYDDRIEKMEHAIYRNPHVRIAQNIFKMKRTIHMLRRNFVEERTILGAISHQSFPYTRPEADVYFVDIYDHLSRIVDSLDIYRDSLNGLLELQMNMKSDRMNEIMKTLTIASTFFMPLTFIVGIYGMNFKRMPELDWDYGYVAVWIVMIAVSVALWIFYKRKKWM
ncbi:magnesium/cobalt transporter CorA [Paenibacillus flagellatus]|uniref:Magnesium transport protein CorA n=1 Tax=Paenibacillus flagellatus TaxID=2211139 RepID=A0A2V5K1H5_9BACL|nr:magnesium/cobalt transporter CorA [Paenibacillus flagellatus]PYI52951.1 magnesium and cobalt transport protein CorA [Paenibacillus flagellatus]